MNSAVTNEGDVGRVSNEAYRACDTALHVLYAERCGELQESIHLWRKRHANARIVQEQVLIAPGKPSTEYAWWVVFYEE